jgi:hypothetical protein
VKRLAINGRDIGEIGQVAAIVGHFSIPVIVLAAIRPPARSYSSFSPTPSPLP